ncbi:MAG: NAD(P)/FAD-dependent oxidoreductase [Lachnospiraceae bacterium]|nr:NAD(P)/FAD-dependent oxidoreductase [Lachnospiraceae bacterium]
MKSIVVVGGGAAGMMAAIQGAGTGHKVTLIEKNEKLGKKLFITGKGRCNITNACDVSVLFHNIVSNPKFLYSAFYGFSNADTIEFFHSLGLQTKIERGERVFPLSDKSSDVIRLLEKECERLGVTIHRNTTVKDIKKEGNIVTGVFLQDDTFLSADSVILAAGGLSYSATGATGDGYKMAEKLGHTVTRLRPGLTGMVTKEEAAAKMQGLTLKNVSVEITGENHSKKKYYKGFGELLLTHYGVSGPLILSASSLVGDCLEKEPLCLHIDLKPALEREQLDKRLLRDFEEMKNVSLKNALAHLLPKSMIPVMLEYCGLAPGKKVNQMTKEDRGRLLTGMKDFKLTLTGLRDIEEAIITRGGIKVSEVDPATMESKLVGGLYFAGEILDLDALTGGFNLQIAWSTGYAAGNQK